MRFDPRTLGIRRIIRDGALIVLVAGAVLFAGYYVSLGINTESALKPYASVEILPDSLEQHPIDRSSTWGLFYAIAILKPVSCDEVLVDRLIYQIGRSLPLVSNADVSADPIAASDEVQVIDGLLVRLPSTLLPGDYLFVWRSLCRVEAPDKPGLEPVGIAAVANICFRVPEAGPIPTSSQRLQPITEDCKQGAY